MLRKIVAALILVPLAVIIIAFAVANRQRVTISLDPFGSDQNAAFATQPLPLYLVLIAVLLIGVVIGGAASWLRQGRWRGAARRLERDLRELRQKFEAHGAAGDATTAPQDGIPPARLRLRPPAR